MKSNHAQFIMICIATTLMLFGCSPIVDERSAQPATAEATVKTLYVGAEQVDCVGVGPQKCLLVKENPADEYQNFYSKIDGFDWESGFEYELLVAVTKVENAPADASSLRYELVEVVKKTPIAVAPIASLLDGTWTLHSLIADSKEIALVEGSDASLTINADQVSGSTGCNNFTGSATFSPGTASFGPLATTRKACPEANMAVEAALLAVFEKVTTYSWERGSLELRNEDGSMVAHFVSQTDGQADAVAPMISFLDGKWSIDSVTSEQTTYQLPYGNFAYLAIDGENVSGSAGCNSFSGTAKFDRGAVTFAPLAVTRKMCADANVMAFENALMKVFENATAYEANARSIEIHNADSTMNVSLSHVSQKTLFVGAEQVDCMGVGPRKCLLVKENAGDEPKPFFDQIIGFDWEAGYEYELLVELSNIANPPADASSLRYELVKIVSKTKV